MNEEHPALRVARSSWRCVHAKDKQGWLDFAAGSESAHLMTLATSFPNGVKMFVHGIFTYRVNDAGKLQGMRGYWTLEDSRVEPPS